MGAAARMIEDRAPWERGGGHAGEEATMAKKKDKKKDKKKSKKKDDKKKKGKKK
jgi:hypothetical protein